MSDRIKAAVVVEHGKLEFRDFARPQIGTEDGLLELEMTGVCASDPGWFWGKMPLPQMPLILGHELLGRIAEVGSVAAKRWGVKPGDRVIVEGSIRCDACPYCHTGQYHLCDHRISYGSTVGIQEAPSLWGGYAQQMYLHPKSMVHKISDDVPGEAAVIIGAVLGNAIRWVRDFGQVKVGDVVVIQGCGPQGLSAIVAARECGAACVIITGLSRDQQRLQLARELGADYTVNVEEEDVQKLVAGLTGGRMADVVVELSGAPAAVVQTLDLVRKQGRIVQAGVTGEATRCPMPMDKLIFKEVTLAGVFAHTLDGVVPAIRLVESGKYPIEKMVTHRYRLDEAEHALHVVGRKVPGVDPIKAVLVPNQR